MTADQYVLRLRKMLGPVSPSARDEIIASVYDHFAEQAARGRSPEEAERSLGTPAEFAAQARDQFGIPAGRDRVAQALQIAAGVVAALSAIFAAYGAPIEGNDFSGVLVLFIPALLSIMPAFAPFPTHLAAGIISAILVTIGVGLSWTGFGFLFVPTLMLLWAAVIVPMGVSRDAHVAGRVVASALVLVPGGILIGGMITGAVFVDWLTVTVCLLSVLLAIGVYRGMFIAYLLSAIVGLAAIVSVLFAAGLFFIAFWWSAGLFLTIGLSGVLVQWRNASFRAVKPAA